jgi:pilus assembly protein CpaC
MGQGHRRPGGAVGRGTWLWVWLAGGALALAAAPARTQLPGNPGAPAPVPPPPAVEPVQAKLPAPPAAEKNGEPGVLPGQISTMPPPRPVEPHFPVPPPRDLAFPRPPGFPQELGTTRMPTPEDLQRRNKFIGSILDPEMPLDLVVGRTRLMVLKTVPKRIQIADETIALYNLISPTEVSLMGKSVGTTVLTLWFPDPADPAKQEVLTYQVRVMPDPEFRERQMRVYKQLEVDINKAFVDSVVKLNLIGDKLVVTGNAKDVQEATKILQIIRPFAPNYLWGSGRESPEARVPLNQMPPGAKPVDPAAPLTTSPGTENFVPTGNPYIVNLLRIPGEQQVMLRVTVAEVDRAAARSIGLDFNIINRHGRQVFANNTGSIATGGITGLTGNFSGLGTTNFLNAAPGVAAGPGGFNNLPASLDNGQVNLAISALKELSYAKTLAEPTLVTMNGQTATFLAGGEFPVPVITGFGGGIGTFGLQGVNFVPYGVQVAFTPWITDRDRIRLSIQASVSARDLANGTTNIGGANITGLTTRFFQNVVELREGQTLAVAGLIQNNLGADASRIPFIGELPILASLTGFQRITAGEQELVILITPELVHPFDHGECPPLPGSNLFEPSDLEFYVCGRLESHYGFDFRSPVMTDFNRIRQYRQMEKTYLHGQHGYCP